MTLVTWLIFLSVPSCLSTGILTLLWIKKKSWSQAQYRQAHHAALIGWLLLTLVWYGWVFFHLIQPHPDFWEVLKYAVVA